MGVVDAFASKIGLQANDEAEAADAHHYAGWHRGCHDLSDAWVRGGLVPPAARVGPTLAAGGLYRDVDGSTSARSDMHSLLPNMHQLLPNYYQTCTHYYQTCTHYYQTCTHYYQTCTHYQVVARALAAAAHAARIEEPVTRCDLASEIAARSVEIGRGQAVNRRRAEMRPAAGTTTTQRCE